MSAHVQILTLRDPQDKIQWVKMSANYGILTLRLPWQNTVVYKWVLFLKIPSAKWRPYCPGMGGVVWELKLGYQQTTCWRRCQIVYANTTMVVRLAPCVARWSSAMILTEWSDGSLFSTRNTFDYPYQSQCGGKFESKHKAFIHGIIFKMSSANGGHSVSVSVCVIEHLGHGQT